MARGRTFLRSIKNFSSISSSIEDSALSLRPRKFFHYRQPHSHGSEGGNLKWMNLGDPVFVREERSFEPINRRKWQKKSLAL
jgi:hypothetical protein